jgi:hypothetical protein
MFLYIFVLFCIFFVIILGFSVLLYVQGVIK